MTAIKKTNTKEEAGKRKPSPEGTQIGAHSMEIAIEVLKLKSRTLMVNLGLVYSRRTRSWRDRDISAPRPARALITEAKLWSEPRFTPMNEQTSKTGKISTVKWNAVNWEGMAKSGCLRENGLSWGLSSGIQVSMRPTELRLSRQWISKMTRYGRRTE